jgi:hypothetical protein
VRRSVSIFVLSVALIGCQRGETPSSEPSEVDGQAAFVASTSTRSSPTTTRAGAAATVKAAGGIEGLPVEPRTLVVGDCFNRYSGLQNYETIEIITKRPCEQSHDAEVFYKAEFAGSATLDTYPGKEKLTNDSIRVCYANFEGFVGRSYETSTYQLGYFVPPQEQWESITARSRAVTCYVTAYVKGTKLMGTVRDSQS